MADLYSVLGVPRGASAAEIKRAYRQRARESHPDAGGDEEVFKQVTHAYQVLSDDQARARYDRFGDDGTPSSRGNGGGDPFGFGSQGFGGIGDVIDAFFGSSFGGATAGGRGRTVRNQPGRDVLVPVELDLEDVAAGVRRPVEVGVAVTCEHCHGSGSESSAAATACSTCGGQGQVQRVVRTAFGQLASATTCPTCQGSGTQVSDPCPVCRGEGRHDGTRTITVEIPAGIGHGDRLRVSGAGEAGRNGAANGDLYVDVHVAAHEIFERDGRDLHARVQVPFVQAALGSKLTVPVLGGESVTIEVPSGTQPGEVLSVRKAGLPRRGGGVRGDLLLTIDVEVPRDLDSEQRELLGQLATLRGEDVPAEGRGLFSRLRGAFR